MNRAKHFVCLVTLLLAGGLPLMAAGEVRTWTDNQGRAIQARLVEILPDGTVKIERADGQMFNLPVAKLSAADQAYVAAQKPAAPSVVISDDAASLRALAPQDWELLAKAVSTLSPRTYDSTPAEDVLAMINKRLESSEFRLPGGEPMKIVLGPGCEGTRITAEIRSASNLATFLKELTKSGELAVGLDSSSRLVLHKPITKTKDDLQFLGVGGAPGK